MHPEVRKIARLIDHAILHPTHTEKETIAACEVGRKYAVGAVCVKPCFTAAAARVLAGSGVAVCAVTGFPHGSSTTATKIFETAEAIRNGATEIDVVVNNGWVAESRWDDVAHEIRAVQKTCADAGVILKVIFENDYLRPEQIATLCRICSEAGVAFAKTSTGFGYVKQANGDFNYKGATVEAVSLMRTASAPSVKIKAAAGIRNLDDLLKFRDLGCARIGAAATVAILAEAESRFAGSTAIAAVPDNSTGY
jgi:deoxyribose-phosphate aldolase